MSISNESYFVVDDQLAVIFVWKRQDAAGRKQGFTERRFHIAAHSRTTGQMTDLQFHLRPILFQLVLQLIRSLNVELIESEIESRGRTHKRITSVQVSTNRPLDEMLFLRYRDVTTFQFKPFWLVSSLEARYI